MNGLVPIALFVCITYGFTYSIKAVVDGRMRHQLSQGGVSEDLLRTILAGEGQQRRLASLRWGLTLVFLAIGFGLIQISGWTQELTPGTIAVLAGAIGLGQLAFFAISARFIHESK